MHLLVIVQNNKDSCLGLVHYYAVKSVRWVQMFWRNILPPSSGYTCAKLEKCQVVWKRWWTASHKTGNTLSNSGQGKRRVP